MQAGDVWPFMTAAIVCLAAGAVVARNVVAALVMIAIVVAAIILVCAGITRLAIVALAIVPVGAGLTTGANGEPGVGGLPILSAVNNAALLVGFLVAFIAVVPRGRLRFLAYGIAVIVAGELAGIGAHNHGLGLDLKGAWVDLRWLGILGWGIWLCTAMSLRQRQRAVWVLLLGWNVINIVVSLLQIAAGSAAYERLGFPVANGLFGHPTGGAVAATMLVCLVVTDIWSPVPVLRPSRRQMALAVAVVGIVISLRFKPVLALAPVAIYCMFYGRLPRLTLAVILIVVPMMFVSFALGRTNLTGGSLSQNVLSHASTRVLLLQGAERLAHQNFPFGSGIGTFGARQSNAVETTAFDQAGIGDVYGFTFTFPMYRGDNLVAHVLGERGYLGLVLWWLALVLLVLAFWDLSPTHWFPATGIIAAAGMAPVLPSLLTPSDALLLMIPAVLFLDFASFRSRAQ